MHHASLLAYNEQFRKDGTNVAPVIWNAVGFAASNQHMIEVGNSATIIDTYESTSAAKNVLVAFVEITDKLVGRNNFSDSDRNSISGVLALVRDNEIQTLASPNFRSEISTTAHNTYLWEAKQLFGEAS